MAHRYGSVFLGFAATFVAVSVILLFGFVAMMFVRSAAVNRERALLRDANIPSTIEELAEKYAIPENVENAADIYEQAFRAHEPLSSELSPLVPVSGNYELPFGTPMPPHVFNATMQYLKGNEESLRLLNEARTIEFCRFDRDYSISQYSPKSDFGEFSENFGHCRGLARIAYLETLVARDSGHYQEGVDAIDASLGLTRYVCSAPGTIGFLVAMATNGIAISSAIDFISTARIPDEELARLQRVLRRAESELNFQSVVNGQPVESEDYARYFEDEYSGLKRLGAHYDDYKQSGRSSYTYEWLTGELAQDTIQWMQFARWYEANSELPIHQIISEWSTIVENGPGVADSPTAFKDNNTQQMALIYLESFGRAYAWSRAARIGVAARRYAQEHNEFPASLEELRRYFEDGIPVDPFSGDDLLIATNGKQWWVYSVGRDGEAGAGYLSETEWFDGDDIGFFIRMPPSN